MSNRFSLPAERSFYLRQVAASVSLTQPIPTIISKPITSQFGANLCLLHTFVMVSVGYGLRCLTYSLRMSGPRAASTPNTQYGTAPSGKVTRVRGLFLLLAPLLALCFWFVGAPAVQAEEQRLYLPWLGSDVRRIAPALER